jgi:tetratricopeptide (TPR) repeat protein/tRNA A-37 threonylcarbamoyl transferase component Bud32
MSETLNERDDRLAGLLTEALDTYRSHGTVDLAAWQARHPDVAAELPELLDTLRNLETAVEDWKRITSSETRVYRPGTEGAAGLGLAPAAVVPERIGRYRVLGRIGQGGMGTVYRAEDPQLERVVAVKVPRFEGPEHLRETAAKRFLREARAAAQVRHPHVCPIHDVGEQDGVPYVVMEYVEGQSLADRLAGHRRYEDPAEAVRLVRQVAEALEAVHARGLIHRDLKPGNILLDTARGAILTDFGLARSQQDGEHLTADGALLGTPAYMAPEQVSKTVGPVGPWTDLYSLGVVLYQMLTGRLPFEGQALELLYSVAHETPDAPSKSRPDLDPSLEGIVLRAMARRPDERYRSAREFADALEHWSASASRTPPAASAEGPPSGKPAAAVVRAALPDGSAVTVTLEGGVARPGKMNVRIQEQRGRKKRRLLVVSVTLALALLAVVLGLSVRYEMKADPKAEAARQKAPAEAARQAEAKTPSVQLVVVKGQALYQQHEYDKAIEQFNEALRLSPNSAAALACRAEAYLALHEPDKARADAEQAIRLEPTHAVAWTTRGHAHAAAKAYDAALADFTEALRLQEQLVRDHPNAAQYQADLAGVYNSRGFAHSQQKAYDAAIQDYTRAIQLDPKFALAFVNRGTSRLAKKEYDLAIADCTEAVRLDPALPSAYFYRADAYGKKGDRARADADWALAVKLDPKLGPAHADRKSVGTLPLPVTPSPERSPAAPTPSPVAIPPVPRGVAAEAGSIERELLNHVPNTLGFLRERGYHHVGVLKFRVKKADEDEASDNVGPLNQSLATRLELALVLANDDKNPVGVLRDASLVASLIPKSNHLIKEGRQVLFGPKYPPAWGSDTPVEADAFLSGGVRFSPDLRVMQIRFHIFAKDGNVYTTDEPFFVTCDPGVLIEAGESFLVRGGLKGDEPLDPAKAIDAAVALRKQQVLPPLLDKENAPVSLEVRYDDMPVMVQYRDGKFQVPEAKEGQRVSFTIRRQAAADQRLGIVLKVNGQNTILRERLPDAQCRKWVLEPDVAALTVDHIQTDDKEDKGEIQAPAVPKTPPGEIRYTADVGTISLVVFREARGKSKAPAAGSEDLAALARAGFPKDKAKDLAALKEQLHKDGGLENAAQGLAVPANPGEGLRPVEFRADPTPLMAITITCQRP